VGATARAGVGRPDVEPPSRLARRLGLADAVVVGLGSMLGAGVFVAFGPAARVAGPSLLIGLAVAAAVAACNATSSARLAALYPASGGAYVYGRERLGAGAGYLAGWAFVAGKLASCAAMAFTFGVYVWPAAARPLAIAAVVVLVAVNLGGVAKTAWATWLLVTLTLAALVVCVAATLGGGSLDTGHLAGVGDAGALDILRSAGFLFFAFAGYARIATLGEEVRDPARTIPRAIALSLGVVLAIYALVAVAALLALGAPGLAATAAPLRAAVEAGSLDGLAGVIRAGAALAALGVLLSLLAGVGRTVFAMAANGDLPRALSAVHGRSRVPHLAELAAGAVVVAVVSVADLRGAIGFSSVCVLAYYAIANGAALTLPGSRTGRIVALLGLGGCITVGAALPGRTLLAGAVALGVGSLTFAVSRYRGRPAAAATRD
jgi:APA family basic amino acid/polyamine antiporter